MITIEPPGSRNVQIDGWSAWDLSRLSVTRFSNKAQAVVGLTGEVEILLTGDSTLRRLNRDYRSKDKPTDVLSFPPSQEFGCGHAGDLAISLQTAKRQAVEHGHTLLDEVRILLLHGFLHLAGMDHEVDRGEMAEREAVLREQLGIPVGLIERVTNPEKRVSETEINGLKSSLKRDRRPSKQHEKRLKRVTA